MKLFNVRSLDITVVYVILLFIRVPGRSSPARLANEGARDAGLARWRFRWRSLADAYVCFVGFLNISVISFIVENDSYGMF